MLLSVTRISGLAITGGIFLSALTTQAQDCIQWIFRTSDVAAQTVTPEAKSASLGTRKFSSSDLFIVVVYEAD